MALPTTLPTALVTDRAGALGAITGLLTGLPPAAVAVYVLLRLLIPVGLIVLAAHDASPAQRIALVRDYLLGADLTHPGATGHRRQR